MTEENLLGQWIPAAQHPTLGLNLPEPISHGRNPPDVFEDVLLADEPDWDYPAGRRGHRGPSVPAGQFGEVYGEPPVVAEAEELDFAKEGSGHGLGREPPGGRVGAEVEARKEQADAGRGVRACDQGQLREDVRGAACWD
jgi:hypothetical protein